MGWTELIVIPIVLAMAPALQSVASLGRGWLVSVIRSSFFPGGRSCPWGRPREQLPYRRVTPVPRAEPYPRADRDASPADHFPDSRLNTWPLPALGWHPEAIKAGCRKPLRNSFYSYRVLT
jgi:hypothetical protein